MPTPDGQPKLTKKERGLEESARARVEASQAPSRVAAKAQRRRLRRLLLGGLAVGTGAIVISTGALIYIQSAPAVSKTDDEIAARLHDLDGKIRRNPNILTDTALEIAEMAAETFHRDTGRERINIREVMQFYDTPGKYLDGLNSIKTCRASSVDPLSDVAATYNRANRIVVNLQQIIYDSRFPNGIDPEPAAAAYFADRHEFGHLTVKEKPIRPEFAALVGTERPLDGFIASGLTVFKWKDDGCYDGLRIMTAFEEAVVNDHAERGVRKLKGYQRFLPRGYEDVTSDLRTEVLGPYFLDDPNRLFQIQGESDPLLFIEEIGRKARVKTPNQNWSNGDLGMQVLTPMISKYRNG